MKKTFDVMSKIGKWLLVFGFVFSEISFPLEVIADELLNDGNESVSEVIEEGLEDEALEDNNDEEITNEDNTSDEYLIVNFEDGTYTIEEELIIKVVYQDKEEVIDFTNKLYGVYEYTFNDVSEKLTIIYEGNNTELLTNKETKIMTCSEDTCVIEGINYLTMSDINEYYNLVDKYNANVNVVNSDGDLVETILNDYKITFEDSNPSTTLDNGVLVNITDKNIYRTSYSYEGTTLTVEEVLKAIRDEEDVTLLNDINKDGILNILDATFSIDTPEVVEGDILTNTLTVDEENLYIGDTTEVKLYVSGFDKASLYGIEGLLNYDENILELTGAELYKQVNEEIVNLGKLNLENGKFAFVLGEEFNKDDVALLTLRFEAKNVGTSTISINNIIESYGQGAFELENKDVEVSVEVLPPKGGDVDDTEEDKTEDTEEDSTLEEDNKETTTEVTEDTKVTVKPVAKSSDYYISKLEIEGYEIDFDKYTYEYSIKVGSDVESLKLIVLLNSSKSIYYVEGNENFKEGENLVYITVKAENGSTKTYTIKVTKEKEKVAKADKDEDTEGEEEEVTNNASKTVVIILIILVIIGLIYVIFKDDEEEAQEVKKSSKNDEIKITKVEPKKTTSQAKTTTQTKKTTTNSGKKTSSSNKTKKTNKK